MQIEPQEPLYQIMLARYYSSSLGRFMGVDPSEASWVLGDPGSWNRFVYCGNNPLRYRDPDGELMVDTITYDLTQTMADADLRDAGGGRFLVEPTKGISVLPNDVVVRTNFSIWVASDVPANLAGEIGGHENKHFGQYLEARAELGYADLDAELLATWRAVEAKGAKKGWSADRIKAEATKAVSSKAARAFKRIERRFDAKAAAFDRQEEKRRWREGRGHTSLRPHTGGPQTPGAEAKVLVDGVDVSYVR